MKKLLTIIFLFFSSCGIEVPQPVPRLYSPNGLIVENVFNSDGDPTAVLRVTWHGLNPELEFSGYNIYYTDNDADATAFKGTKILCRNFNPRQSTLVVLQPFNISRPFSYDVKKFYYETGELFINNKQYWFFVTAFNQVRNLESPPSMWASVIFKDNTD